MQFTRKTKWTILELLQWSIKYLKEKGIEAPRTEAEVLLAHALGLKRIDLYLRYDQPLKADELATYKSLIKRRIAREPSQYITGSKEFWSLEFEVNRAVLIPRPETEILVEKAIECMGERGYRKLLEIGTGSGAIAIAIAHEVQHLDLIVATDISKEALAVAVRNAKKHNLEDKICFIATNLFDGLNPKVSFDLILSNPPYLSEEEYKVLPPEIKFYEPPQALKGGEDGTEVIKNIIATGWHYLSQGGMMFIEIGHNQKELIKAHVENLLPRDSYKFSVFKDYGGFDRLICLEKLRKSNG